MEVKVEEQSGLERRMTVTVPEEKVEKEVNERLDSMARTVNIPGFRPGRVPVKVVRQRYGRQVRDEVVGEIVRTSFQDALTRESLRLAGSPTIDDLRSEPGSGVTYQAMFEIFPVVSMPSIDGLAVVRPVSEVMDEDVEHMIETLQRQRRTWEPAERVAAIGDRAIIDFAGTCEGEPIRDGEAQKVPVELGAGRMVNGFEDGLVGCKAGDDLELDVVFPETAPDETVAGKAAQFTVHVHAVEEAHLPAVDEDFIRGFGVAEGDGESFRKEIRANMGRELDEALRATTKKRVMDALLEKQTVELPNAMVSEETARMVNQQRTNLVYQGVDPDTVTLDPAHFEADARRRITLGLLLGQIVKENDMQADPELVRERIESIASTYDESDKVVNWYYGNPERLNEIESAVLEDQVVEWVLAQTQVSDEPTTFDELLNPGQTSRQDA